MEVTSRRSFYAMLLMNFGLIFALGLISWRLMGVKFLDATGMYLVWILLAGLYAYQTYQAFQVNQDLLSGSKIYSTSERYQFRQVGLLGLAYAVTFGAELAAVSMLPGFLEDTFGLNHTNASMIAASYPFVNLISRPSGGLISDKLGNRKWTITALLLGVAIGYLLLQKINSGWSIPLTITLIMLAAFFAQACNGANFGMVPLIKKEVTGQIAGNVGAYGNFGAVIFLTIFSFNNASTLFTSIGISAIICASLCAFFLKEPQGSFAAHHTDETAETLPQSEPPMLLDGKENY
jgi:NNP family nitrate/nitrite transporter-like MFS transporter